MITFAHNTLQQSSPELENALKADIEKLSHDQLPLQQALAHSSMVTATPFQAVILNTTVSDNEILLKAGIFYTGIIAGCNCADDPSPADEVNEYCEVEFTINRDSGKAIVSLLDS